MKLTAVLLLSACLTAAAKGKSQTVTLDMKDAPIQKVLTEVIRQTGVSIIYNEVLFKNAVPVTIQVKNATVQDVLNKCFQSQPFSYTLESGAIVIKQKPTENNPDLISIPNEPPPPTDITGRITNEQGEPLSGASVIIKRTGRGDIADAQGDFHLKDVTNDDYIIISFAGYKTQTIKVGSITKFTIVMQVTDNDLDKVVIQAYGTTTQRLATGNIATVRAEQIERQPVMNALAALQGQIPGLIVTQNNGYASSSFKIELRGRSVIDGSQPSEPLYIVDGVPLTVMTLGTGSYAGGSTGFDQTAMSPAGGQSPFFSINPLDIESITVLKDADATAIYGSRGANGVIIITTKKGNVGKTKLDVNVYQGVSIATSRYRLLNTQQYIKMRSEAFQNDQATFGLIPGLTVPDVGNAYDLLSWDTTSYTDWQKYYWGGTGHTTDMELSLSGGDKQNTFRIGGSIHHETNIFTKSGLDQRGSIQFNYSHKSLDQRLNISLTSSYSFTQSDLKNVGGNVLEAPDAPPIFDSQGNINWYGWQPVSDRLDNWGSLFQPYVSKTGFLNSQLNVQYEIIKGLKISTEFGYSTMHSQKSYLAPIISQNPFNNPKGFSRFGNTNNDNAIVEPQLHFDRLLGKGKLSALIGGSVQSVESDFDYLYGTGYINDNLLNSISGAPIKTASDGYGQYKYASIFGRISYSLNNRYILNVSGRRDGSSKFGPGKQFGNFGALGGAWIFSEEKWLKKHMSFLSFGKLRASYGLTGNDQILDYAYLTQWSASSLLPYQNTLTYAPLLHANPDLEWETNKKLEIAGNLNFLADKIMLEIVWYRNHCGNQLISHGIPILTGFGNVTENSPALIENTGWEFSLKGDLLETKNIAWTAFFNIGFNKNKLLAYPNLSQSVDASVFTIGQSLSIKRLLHYTGVDSQTGQYTFDDKNKNGSIDYRYNNGDNDLYNIDLAVKFDGGFGTEVKYKKVHLNLYFIFRKWKQPSAIYNGTPGSISNQSVEVLDHWQKPGDHAKFARFTNLPLVSDGLFGLSDGIYSDASFVRLRNVSISYDLPNSWIRKINVEGAEVYLRAENLFVITRYDGIDPETSSLGALPPSRIFTGGIKFIL